MSKEKGKKLPEVEAASETGSDKTPIKEKEDVIVWIASMCFLILYLTLIFSIGYVRHYNMESGYSCNYTVDTCDSRFLSEPFVEEPGIIGRHGEHATSRWYFWKLKPQLVKWYTRLFPWILYLLHQFFVWLCIFQIQYNKRKEKPEERYTHQFGKWNWIYLGGNTLFFILHFAQTHITYDALAQDVSVSSPQSAAIMLLIFIMMLEYRDRGIFFGWPSQFHNSLWSRRLRLTYDVMYLIRRYHGYAFAWAFIFTFWYHPLEGTFGHLTGTFHIFIILLQGNLAFTKFHLNKNWRFFVETWVTVHGAIVAAQTGGPSMKGTTLWPMFLFGFLFMVFFTQLFGLPIWKKLPTWSKFFPVLFVYIPVVLAAYSWIPDREGNTWVRIQEIIRIPAVYYGYFFLTWLFTWVFLKIQERCVPVPENPDMWRRGLALTGAFLIFALFVGISVAVQLLDWQLELTFLMIFFVFVFMFGSSVTFVLMDWVFCVKTKLPGSSIDVNKDNDVQVSVKEKF